MSAEKRILPLRDGRVTALGGCGENGRNCFLLETPGGKLLLDCGVKREWTDDWRSAYPALDEQTARCLDAVLLTHCHEDHCAALPYLYALGYRGAVYASRETIEETPRMMKKWTEYARSRGMAVPYTEQDIGNVRFCALKVGENTVGAFSVLTGRSGHTIGSLWAAIRWADGARQLFYSGDMCLCSKTLVADMPPECACAVLNCAYADRVIHQARQYDALKTAVVETFARGGRLLLPLPSKGRGADTLLFLAQELRGIPIYAEDAIVRCCEALYTKPDWTTKRLPEREALERVIRVRTDAERARALEGGPGVYLTTDGMLTTKEGRAYAERLMSGAENLTLITGHAAKGTLADCLRDPAWRQANGVKMRTKTLVIKVHLDAADTLRIVCRALHTNRVMLFHAPAENCARLSADIASLPF